MKELKKSDDDKHKEICTKIREDGAYVEAGENDNLLVQKVSADPGALGVLGYSFLEENADKVAPVSIAGVAPTEATISDLSYPGSRRLYVYVKGEHLAAKPAIKQFIEAYSKAWGKGGTLEKRGLVPLARRRGRRPRRPGDGADAARPGEPEVSGSDGRHDAQHCARRGPGDRRRRRPVRPQPGERAARRRRAPQQPAQLSRASMSACGRRCRRCCSWRSGRRSRPAWSTRRCWPRRPGSSCPDFDMARDTILTEAREIAAGEREAGFNPESAELAPIYAAASAPLCRDRRRHRDPHCAGSAPSSRCAGSGSISAPGPGSSAG